MRAHPFAIIVSGSDPAPIATHLPFHLKMEGDEIILTAHFAKANPQWKNLAEVLVIFSGPHAYISPQHYEQEQNVPTWNYIAVHAYGTAVIVKEENEGISILEELIQQSEPAFLTQWERLSTDYKNRLYKGIVPFRIRVTRIDAKEKLSQNKKPEERMQIIAALHQDADAAARDLAGHMEARE